MNGMCKVLDCYYGAILNPSDDTWTAVKVRRDGNQINIIGGCDTEEEAEQYAAEEHRADIEANSQFGAGA